MENTFKLQKINNDNFQEFYSLLSEDFCYEERHDFENELLNLKNSNFNPCFIIKGEQVVGYVCYWNFENLTYIEHFAILKDLRNQGIGTEFLKWFLIGKKQVVVEVERPEDEIKQKRIKFYKNLGFVVNGYDYIQPSYHNGEDKVPMLILSFNKKIEKKEYQEFINLLNKFVYRIV